MREDIYMFLVPTRLQITSRIFRTLSCVG